jgi:hypothetical protein
MIRHGGAEVWVRHMRAAVTQQVERVERAFMQKVPVDPQQRLAILAHQDFVLPPDFLEQAQHHRAAAPVCRTLHILAAPRRRIAPS